MAAKKKASAPTAIPEAHLSKNESHKYVARFKKSWEKRFKPTRMEELFEAVDLGIYLTALGRHKEASDLLSYVTGLVEFSGNKNIWSPTGYGIACLSWLYRQEGQDSASQRQLDRIRENGFINCKNLDYLKSPILEHREELSSAADETQKWGCHGISRHLMGLYFLRETVEGFEHSSHLDAGELDPLIEESLSALRSKLG